MRNESSLAPSGVLISVVIPTYKRPASVRRAVISILNQDLPKDRYELLVVDSSPGGTDAAALADLMASAECAFRCLVKKAEGPGASRNFGAMNSDGHFLAFMDSDCEASPQWLHLALAAFTDGIGLVQGRTLPDPAGKLGIFTWYLKVNEESFIYESANVIYSREAFEQVGGFWSHDLTPSAIRPMGGEDVDLAWRVKRSGWRSKFAPEALVFHEVQPITLWGWLVSRRLFIWPALVRDFPELRSFFYKRYFYNRAQALFTLGLAGLALVPVSAWGLIMLLPYVVLRTSESTNSLQGPLRPLRAIFYFARDTISFALLTAGSLWFRALLL